MGVGVAHVVVGPSGVGKDTLIDIARAARPDLLFVRRAITRPACSGGEAHEAVSAERFERMAEAGDFALWWRAHGLSYGLPRSIDDALAAGRSAVFNGSRAMIPAARARFSPLRILFVTAAPEVLSARLAARGREDQATRAARLSRAASVP
ncbi:MAG: phosphonate metabolism protein/1,5-bisphosphokinase (PRPP-forming) PhnN, partial [Rubrimonas sp.]